METTFSHTNIQLIKGDISNQEGIDAIVNAANVELRIGGGVAGAIHKKGDPELTQLTRPLAPIKPGEAVITEAPGLPNNYVIHCLGPVYGRDEPSDELLAKCYKNALYLAEKHELTSIAFPAISTGAFGYPINDAANIAFETVKVEAHELEFVQLIRFVLFSEDDLELHKEVLDEIVG